MRDRSFTIGDAMILVGAVALGLELHRRIWRDLNVRVSEVGSWRSDSPLTMVEHTVAAFLIPLTVSCLAIRLRQPRPPFRRIARELGFSATALASGLIALDAAMHSSGIILFGQSGSTFLSQCIYAAIGHCGVIVAGAWFSLAAGGRRRPGSGWIDRAGITIGACWIIVALSPIFHQIYMFLQVFRFLRSSP